MKTYLKALLFTLPICLAGCSTIGDNLSSLIPGAGGVPSKLTPPTGKPVLTLQAKGVQVFRCTVDSKGPYYRFERPDATLYEGSEKVGTLSGPMSAISYKDGSSIISTRVSAWANPSDPKKDLVLALLSAVPNDKPGVLEGVRYIQRLDTKGGIPQSNCSQTEAGKLLKVPFTAEFVFWK
ncbi:DUF3455 domain-containing protein [uncultured Turicimonas sp.]|uniref:DUF3455 domain-containing protein n=1 Tax=uncultured Turicimonas sp. TaxID=1918607 RepID=UPI002803761B|nr:DUF3455 domain-containing protein [uncultured Turicimonas sp.]